MAWDMEYWHVNGKRLRTCKELRKRNVDLCCLQEVRWRGCGDGIIGVRGIKYKSWWSGNQEENGGVGVLAEEELHDEVHEVRRINDRVMSLAIVFEEEVVGVVCAYTPQSGKSIEEKYFLMKICKENLTSELIIGM